MSTETAIRFRGFDERAAVEIYDHGALPHWQQEGCTYFVTFRLADSIPQNVLRQIEHERKTWLAARGINPHEADWIEKLYKLPPKEKQSYERLVGHAINKELDKGYGACHLRKPEIAEEVVSAVTCFDGSRVHVGDFVIMPNHVHVLMTPLHEFKLHNLLHSIKSYSANQVNKLLGKTGTFWQRESHDHIVRDYEQLEAYQEYIARNPTKINLPQNEFVHRPARYIPDD